MRHNKIVYAAHFFCFIILIFLFFYSPCSTYLFGVSNLFGYFVGSFTRNGHSYNILLFYTRLSKWFLIRSCMQISVSTCFFFFWSCLFSIRSFDIHSARGTTQHLDDVLILIVFVNSVVLFNWFWISFNHYLELRNLEM